MLFKSLFEYCIFLSIVDSIILANLRRDIVENSSDSDDYLRRDVCIIFVSCA